MILPSQPPEAWKDCTQCGGEGVFEVLRPFWDDPFFCKVETCNHCNGAGGFICSADEIPEIELEEIEDV